MERSDDARLAAFLASNAAHRAKLNEARARDVAKQQAFRAEFGEAIERWREDQEQALEAEPLEMLGVEATRRQTQGGVKSTCTEPSRERLTKRTELSRAQAMAALQVLRQRLLHCAKHSAVRGSDVLLPTPLVRLHDLRRGPGQNRRGRQEMARCGAASIGAFTRTATFSTFLRGRAARRRKLGGADNRSTCRGTSVCGCRAR